MPLFLEWIDFLIFGLVGFLLTLITLLKTLGTKRAVSKAFSRVELRKDLPEYIEKLAPYVRIVLYETMNSKCIFELRLLLSELSIKYKDNFGSELNNEISDTTLFILGFIDNPMSENSRSELSIKLTKIIELLKKEEKF